MDVNGVYKPTELSAGAPHSRCFIPMAAMDDLGFQTLSIIFGRCCRPKTYQTTVLRPLDSNSNEHMCFFYHTMLLIHVEVNEDEGCLRQNRVETS